MYQLRSILEAEPTQGGFTLVAGKHRLVCVLV